MINQKTYELGSKRSTIRELFEYAKIRSAQIGAENVFDFSIGNPSVPAPKAVDESIKRLVEETPSVLLHGYTSAQGDKTVRDTLAEKYQKRFGAKLSGDDIYMTCGAAASLTITFKALYEEGDEIITFAPFFPEYKVFVEGVGAKLIALSSTEKMLPDFTALEKAITPHTKAVLINSPNNPSGVVYGKETIEKLCTLLKKKSQEYKKPIFLVSDEPYRELIYDKATSVPCVMNYYDNSIVCYSYSKSLSLPGERIGYIALSPKAENNRKIYASICGAGRMLGYVCAPALFQRVVAECDGMTGDLETYRKNRDLLYNGLTESGYNCIYPDGAFYLFVEALEKDKRFLRKSKKIRAFARCRRRLWTSRLGAYCLLRKNGHHCARVTFI